MFALGALLLVAAAALVLWVFYGLNGQSNTIHFDSVGVKTDISPLTLFLLGALTLLLVWMATRLFAAGTRRKYRSHKERKALTKENERAERERLAMQKDRDAAQAERERIERERDLEHDNRETAEARARVWERDAHGTHAEAPRHTSGRVVDEDIDPRDVPRQR